MTDRHRVQRHRAEAPGEPAAGERTAEAGGRTAVRTLLVTDLVSSTRLVESLGDRRAAAVIGRHDHLARDLLAEHRGLEIDKTDGFLLLFERPIDAVHFALDYHQALAELSRELGIALQARSGIHLGELFLRRNPSSEVARGAKPLEVEGLAKPIAARLMSAALGGQTLLTRGAFDLARRAAVGQTSSGRRLGWRGHGLYRLKGLDESIEVFEVGVEGIAPFEPPPDTAKVERVAAVEAARLATESAVGIPRPATRGGRLRQAVLGVLAVAAVAAAGGWFLRGSADRPPDTDREPRTVSPAVQVRRSAAVLGFTNLSQAAEFAWLSTGFAEMLTAELAAGQNLRMIAGQNVARAKIELALADGETLAPDTLARLRSILGADVVLLGSYLAIPEAGQLHVVLNAQDTVSGDTVVTLSETGPQSDIVELVAGLGARLRGELGIDLPSSAAAGQARASLPANPQALKPYAEGLRHLRSYDFATARDRFQRAIEEDPAYPLAHAALAEVWRQLGYDQRARQEADRAVELAGDLSREDQLFVAGRDHEIAGRWEQAARSFQTLYDFFPDNVDYGLRLAGALTRGGRAQEALAVVASLRQLPPPAADDVRIDLAEASAARWLSDYRRVLEVAGAAGRRGEAQGSRLLVARARLAEASAYLRLGESDKAAATVETARRLYASVGDGNGEADALNQVANLAYERGDIAAARQLFDQVLAKRRQVGNQKGIASALHNIADCLLIQGDFAGAEALFREALATVRETGDRQLEGLTHVNLADLALRQGNLGEAHTRAREALELTRGIGFTLGANGALLFLGKIQLAAGDVDAARAALEESLAGWRTAGDSRYVAVTLFYLGNLLLALDDLPAAGERHREAWELHQQLQDRIWMEQSRVARALLAVEGGRPAAALEPLRKAVAAFRSLAVADGEARAAGALVAALLAAGERDGLDPAIAAVAAAAPRSRVETRLWAGIQVARARGSLGEAEAAAALEAVAAEAGRRGFVPLELEARLALGVLAASAGDAAARRRLQDIAADAEVRQLRLIARKAAAVGETPR